MLAPLPASMLRYGAWLLPITLERCLFSKITTTMWSGGCTPPFEPPSRGRGVEGTMRSCCRTAVLGFLGAGSRFGAPGCVVASGAPALASSGVAGATVGKVLEEVAIPDDD